MVSLWPYDCNIGHKKVTISCLIIKRLGLTKKSETMWRCEICYFNMIYGFLTWFLA